MSKNERIKSQILAFMKILSKTDEICPAQLFIKLFYILNQHFVDIIVFNLMAT